MTAAARLGAALSGVSAKEQASHPALLLERFLKSPDLDSSCDFRTKLFGLSVHRADSQGPCNLSFSFATKSPGQGAWAPFSDHEESSNSGTTVAVASPRGSRAPFEEEAS